MKFYGLVPGTTPDQRFMQRADALQAMKVSGTSKPPSPPRGVNGRGGSRKVVLSWELPLDVRDVAGWNIYRDTESNLVAHIEGLAVNQADVAASSGATAPVTNFFVASVNSAGVESNKVQTQCAALNEAGAPSDPPPPDNTGGTGGSGGSGGPRGKYIDPHLG